jgi:hypothetical protein
MMCVNCCVCDHMFFWCVSYTVIETENGFMADELEFQNDDDVLA